MCEDPKDKSFEFQFPKVLHKYLRGNEPRCDVCKQLIDLETPESYHKVYWRCYGGDLYTHVACF